MFWYRSDNNEIPPHLTLPDFSQYGSNADLFHPARVVFRAYYADQLNPETTSIDFYKLDDLLTEDPDVLAQFRHFTLTGEIATATDDPARPLRHIDFLTDDAESETHIVQATGIRLQSTDADTAVRASGALIKNKKKDGVTPHDPDSPTDPWPDQAPCPPPDEDEDGNCIPDALDDGLDSYPDELQLPFENIDDIHPSLIPPRWWRPGIDCDDFADMLAEHHRRHLENEGIDDALIKQLWLTWSGDGQVVTMIVINGKYDVVDPKYPGSVKDPTTPKRTRYAQRGSLWTPFSSIQRTSPINKPTPEPPDGDRGTSPILGTKTTVDAMTSKKERVPRPAARVSTPTASFLPINSSQRDPRARTASVARVPRRGRSNDTDKHAQTLEQKRVRHSSIGSRRYVNTHEDHPRRGGRPARTRHRGPLVIRPAPRARNQVLA